MTGARLFLFMAQSKITKAKMTGKINAMIASGVVKKKQPKNLAKKQAKNLKKKPVVGFNTFQVAKPRLGGY